MRSYDVTELVNFAEQPDGSVAIEPKSDALAGLAWWNALTDQQRIDWMTRAGNTGVAADAWEAFKRSADQP